jgi:hypothetical protein
VYDLDRIINLRQILYTRRLLRLVRGGAERIILLDAQDSF